MQCRLLTPSSHRMRQCLSSLLAWVFLLGIGHADDVGNTSSDGTDDSLGGLVSHLVRGETMSGVVLVASGGETIHEQAFNIDPLQAKFEINTDSAFAIASLTKSFTAALSLDQVSAGRIELDKPVSAYLPEFNAAYANAVTVRQLLQNRSGIPHYVDIPGWFDPEVKGQFTAESFLAEIASLELRFPPGEEYYYSNVNYYLLGLILESATGRSYEALLRERILEPLRLENTGQIYSIGKNFVAPTYLREGDNYEQIQISNPELFRATASQYSSARDLAAFGDAVMNGLLLDKQMRDLLLDEERPMGFTVISASLAGEEVDIVTYNGELAGTTTMLTMFPERDGIIVILSNNNTPYSSLAELTLAVAQLAFQKQVN